MAIAASVAIGAIAPVGGDTIIAAIDVPGCGNTAQQGPQGLPAAMPFAIRRTPVPPPITAQAFAVIDGETGRVLAEQGAHDRRAPASTTKIMTALLTLEHGDLDRVVVSDVDGRAMPESSVMGLTPGREITVRELLFGLMLPSGNDAAIQLAETVSGSVDAFVRTMNERATRLGLANTHFANPHGLDARGHYSSAMDLDLLARAAMRVPGFAELVSTRTHHLAPPSDYDLENGNDLLGAYDGADGVKIGWTERAGWTFVASATRDGHRVFVTVLDSADRDADAQELLDWAFSSYRWLPLGAIGRRLQRTGLAFDWERAAVERALGSCP